MAMGLLSDDELRAELARLSGKSPDVRAETSIVDKPSRGRAEGDVNVPDALRKIIGEEAVINGRQAALHIAKDFGISPSSVSAYAKGATSTTTYDTPSQSILSHINKSRRRAVARASKTLNLSLGSITQEKLDYTDAKDLSVIAKNMSAIIKDLEPAPTSGPADISQNNQFVIYAPSFRDEKSFEVIDVRE